VNANETEILTVPLPGGDIPDAVAEAFRRNELRHHELGLDWLTNLAGSGLPDGERAVLIAASDPVLGLAALPLRLPTRGSASHSLSNWYSSLYAPVVEGPAGGDLLCNLLQHVRRTWGRSSIELSPLDTDSATWAQLQEAMVGAGWRGLHSWTCFGNWTCETAHHDYRRYLAGRPSRLRNTLSRKTRAFLRDGRGELEIVTDRPDLQRALAAYMEVYAHSWKQPEPRRDFIPSLCRLAAARGWLRLGLAYYDRLPVAAQIWLVANGTAHIFKLAYREDQRSLSAGTVLSGHLMQRVIEQDRVDRVDYLTGDDSYKQDWMEHRRERMGLAAFNPARTSGLAGLLEHRLRSAAKRLRSGMPES
jgi:hypothetical protein